MASSPCARLTIVAKTQKFRLPETRRASVRSLIGSEHSIYVRSDNLQVMDLHSQLPCQRQRTLGCGVAICTRSIDWLLDPRGRNADDNAEEPAHRPQNQQLHCVVAEMSGDNRPQPSRGPKAGEERDDRRRNRGNAHPLSPR